MATVSTAQARPLGPSGARTGTAHLWARLIQRPGTDGPDGRASGRATHAFGSGIGLGGRGTGRREFQGDQITDTNISARQYGFISL